MEKTDAADIANDAVLWRRVTPSQHVSPQPDGSFVLVSFAFREQNREFSMYVAAEITKEKLLSCGFPTQRIIALTAGQIRQLGYAIIRDPDECDKSHVYASAGKSKNAYIADCRTLSASVKGFVD